MEHGERKRKVVRPRAVCFGKINESKLLSPLSLPNFSPALPEESFLFLNFRLCELHESGNKKNNVFLCGLHFPLVAGPKVAELEERWCTANKEQLQIIQRSYLASLDGAFVKDLVLQKTDRNKALARGALEKLDELGVVEKRKDRSSLQSYFPSYENSFFLEGQHYELLTPEEFFKVWQRGFHKDIVEHVLSRSTPWSAKELSDYLQDHSDKANAKTLSVVRHRLHSRVEPMVFTFDGREFIPNLAKKQVDLLQQWEEALSKYLRRSFIEELLK